MSRSEKCHQSDDYEINAVFAQNYEMGIVALQALWQAGLRDEVIVVSIDAIDDALKAVKDGRLDATVYQDADAQGQQAVQMALDFIHHPDSVQERAIFIPFQLVTQENVDKFIR